MTMAQTRKAWRKFQMQHPAYQNCDLILKLEHTQDLFKSKHLILDLSTVTNGLQFHTYFELAYRHGQFIILTANQASGFPDYWKHQQNCWITDLKNTKPLSHVVDHTQFTLAESFFHDDEAEKLTQSFENKLNELSRIYSKIISQKNLSYAANKAHS
jgi:hypothetical protein